MFNGRSWFGHKVAWIFIVYLIIISSCFLNVLSENDGRNWRNGSMRKSSMERSGMKSAMTENLISGNETDVCPTKEELCVAAPVDWTDPLLYLKVGAAVVLILLSGLFSGLTLGLLGLDLNSLSIVAKSDPNKNNRKYAMRIIPVRSNGNLLLCTLLLGNVMVNAGFSILTSDLTSGLIGFILSSAVIVVMGEIIPQATCSRYALPIGAYTIWIVYIFMFFLFPIAYPIGKILDRILGKELGTIYDNEGLKELIKLHARSGQSDLLADSSNILQGAIDFSKKTVADVMTLAEKTFMLERHEKLDMDVMSKIWQTGHSRIPVYSGTPDNVVGLLFVKDLILINPDEELPLSAVLTFYGRETLKVFPDTPLNQVLSLFKTGKSHLAMVHDAVEPEGGGDPYYKIVGLVTLEDVIEEIIRDEIVDETDIYLTNENSEMVKRPNRTNIATLLDRKAKSHRLTPPQILAVSTFLIRSSKTFEMIPEKYLQQLLGKCVVVSYKKKDDVFIYHPDREAKHFTLVLQGRVRIKLGKEQFQSELGPWSYCGDHALRTLVYYPDYEAKVIMDGLFLQIKKQDFAVCMYQVVQNEKWFTLPQELSWLITVGKKGAPDDSNVFLWQPSDNENKSNETTQDEGRKSLDVSRTSLIHPENTIENLTKTEANPNLSPRKAFANQNWFT